MRTKSTIFLASLMLTALVAPTAAADHECGTWGGPFIAEFCERYTDHGDDSSGTAWLDCGIDELEWCMMCPLMVKIFHLERHCEP